jgi:hypothetical protein
MPCLEYGSVRSKKEETKESTGSGPVAPAKRFHERSHPDTIIWIWYKRP